MVSFLHWDRFCWLRSQVLFSSLFELNDQSKATDRHFWRRQMTFINVIPFQVNPTVTCHLDHFLVWILVSISIIKPNNLHIVLLSRLPFCWISSASKLACPCSKETNTWLLFSEILSWAQNPQRNGRAGKFWGCVIRARSLTKQCILFRHSHHQCTPPHGSSHSTPRLGRFFCIANHRSSFLYLIRVVTSIRSVELAK